MGKFPGFGGGNSQTPDLAVAIGSNFAKADPQNAFTSGSYRPILLKNSIKMEGCFSAENQSILDFP
jgi:hypothetical protein